MRSARQSLEFDCDQGQLIIRHPAWVIRCSDLELEDGRKLKKSDISSIIADRDDLLSLFENQNLWDFSDLADRQEVPSEEALMVIRACVNEWFGVLYDHPWWKVLSHERDDDKLQRWIVQNYHLSKIASRSAAKAIVAGAGNQQFFLTSIIEEYDHHEHFFRNLMVEHGVDERLFNRPPPNGILALGELLAYLAVNDKLALLIFYYFQECSAHLAEDFRDYYRHLEAFYGLDGYFDAWLNHVDVDNEFDHSGDVELALRDSGIVSGSQLQVSLNHAWLGVCMLLCDYDDFAELAAKDGQPSDDSFFSPSVIKRGALMKLAQTTDRSDILLYGHLLEINSDAPVEMPVPDGHQWADMVSLVASMLLAGDSNLASCILHDDLVEKDVLYKVDLFIRNLLAKKPPDFLRGGDYGSLACS